MTRKSQTKKKTSMARVLMTVAMKCKFSIEKKCLNYVTISNSFPFYIFFLTIMQFDLFSLKIFNALRWFDDKKHPPFCVKLKCVCTCKLNKLLNSSHSKNKKNKDRKCIIFICVHFVYCMSVHFTFMHLVISMLYK